MAVAGPEAPFTRGAFSIEDLSNLPEDGMRHELYDGALLVNAPPSPRHSGIVARLREALAPSLPAELWFLESVGIRVGAARLLIPDLVIVRRDTPLDTPEPFLQATVVIVAVEVESPSTLLMDRTVKPSMYAEAGIPTFVRIVPSGPEGIEVHLYRLGRRRAYRPPISAVGHDTLTLPPPVGATFEPDDLVP